jgi:hypothetical protein
MSSPFLPPDPGLENRIHAIGNELLDHMDAHPAPGIFSKKGAYARLMEWSMRDPAFKTQLFRFVDVLPTLSSSGEIVRHLQEYLGDQAVHLNPALKVGLGAASFAPAWSRIRSKPTSSTSPANSSPAIPRRPRATLCATTPAAVSPPPSTAR